MGHGLTVWTIRISLVAFTAAIGLTLWRWSDPSARRLYRSLWTVAFLAFVLHTGAAFHFYHQWSHTAAVKDTARQTYDLMGWSFGEGIYFSYLFLVLWGADVVWLWLAPQGYFVRPRWFHVGLVAYLVFIAFNGAVVFENGVTRIPGLVATMGLAVMCWRRLRSTVRSGMP